MAALNGDIVLYDAIDHNPIMTALGEQKWGLEGVRVGAFETAKLDPREWVVASGVFTQRRCETEDADLQKLFEDIDILYFQLNTFLRRFSIQGSQLIRLYKQISYLGMKKYLP